MKVHNASRIVSLVDVANVTWSHDTKTANRASLVRQIRKLVCSFHFHVRADETVCHSHLTLWRKFSLLDINIDIDNHSFHTIPLN